MQVDALAIVILPHRELRVKTHLRIVFVTLFQERHGLGRVRRTGDALLLQALENVIQVRVAFDVREDGAFVGVDETQ